MKNGFACLLSYNQALRQQNNGVMPCMNQAMASRQVDSICAFATDGRVAAYDLISLHDDRGLFSSLSRCTIGFCSTSKAVSSILPPQHAKFTPSLTVKKDPSATRS